jgi:hypothetical protein
MVLRTGFKQKLRLYVELKIYDKNRRKITGPLCVKPLSLSIYYIPYLYTQCIWLILIQEPKQSTSYIQSYCSRLNNV